jgi:hypothetical protein
VHVGDRPRLHITVTAPRSDPDAILTALKVIVAPPTGAQTVYTSPHSTLTELADNDWVWEAPTPMTAVGLYHWFVRGTSGIEASEQGTFVIHAIDAALTYA